MQAGNGSNGGIGRKGAQCVTAAVALLAASTAIAATPAGTPIANTATMTRTTDGGVEALTSNTVTLTAAEILNVTITAGQATATTRNGETVAVGFVLTNTGNGQEDYLVSIDSGAAGLSLDRRAIDSDGDGVYSAATDQMLAAGAAVPLTPGQTARVFVLLDGAQVAAATAITAIATARTGSGAAGTVYPNGGDAGSDAVVGPTGATASATTQFAVTEGVPTLAKTQSVLAPDGSARAVPGAIVTYRLVASFPGAARGVVIDDPVPTGTAYVPGSLRLDDAVLSDASSDDAGSATAAAIRVALGDVAAGSRSIQFSVKIQ